MTVASVIPAIDKIDMILASKAEAHNYTPAVKAALKLGQQTLNRYYSKTDNSEIYRIAMSMSVYPVLCSMKF